MTQQCLNCVCFETIFCFYVFYYDKNRETHDWTYNHTYTQHKSNHPRFTVINVKIKHKKNCKFALRTKAMDLPQNRLLGERRRASSTMHRSWHDFQPFDDTRVNRYIHRETLNQLVAVNVEIERINVPDQRTKLIIQQRISVCILSNPIFIPFFNMRSLPLLLRLIEIQFSIPRLPLQMWPTMGDQWTRACLRIPSLRQL